MSATSLEAPKPTPAPVVQLKKTQEPVPAAAAATTAAEKPVRPSRLRKVMLGGLLVAVLLGGASYGYDWFMTGRFQVSTDDAYVKSDMSQLGSKIAGYVTDIAVAENAHVKAGDVILKLDDGDFKLAVAAAQAKIDTQRAVISGVGKQIEAQQKQVEMNVAQLASAQAAERNAAVTLQRTQQLTQKAVASRQLEDNSQAALDQAQAAVAQATAAIAASKAQVEVLQANQVQAEKAMAELQTQLAKTQRDLSFTEIRAPFDGIVANRAVEAGQYVQPGQRLMALVPDQQSYIEANFKETQLASIHPGQKATIRIDALGDKDYEGRIESLAPASGAEFSLLPPENATGNFTKITQRVPVKVAVPPELAQQIRLGLSATVSVDSRDSGTP